MAYALCTLDENNILFAQNDRLYKIQTNEANKSETIHVQLADLLSDNDDPNKPKFDVQNQISAMCASNNSIVIATTHKHIIRLDHQLKKIHLWTIARVATSLIFDTTRDNVIFADKSGDVYKLTLTTATSDEVLRTKPENDRTPDGELLLGHLSMILDIQMTRDNKLIATCDRDEKIKITNYPNTYSIRNFCLGHKEFVTNIAFVNDKLLMSASGDGCIFVWDISSDERNGDIVATLNTQALQDENTRKEYLEQFDCEHYKIGTLPVNRMQYNSTLNFVIFTIFNCNVVFVYKLDLKGDERSVEISPTSGNINVDETIVDFVTLDSSLFVLLSSKIHMFKWGSMGGFESVQVLLNDVVNIAKSSVFDRISVLYKRHFDNMEEYQERKKKRIEGSNGSN